MDIYLHIIYINSEDGAVSWQSGKNLKTVQQFTIIYYITQLLYYSSILFRRVMLISIVGGAWRVRMASFSQFP